MGKEIMVWDTQKVHVVLSRKPHKVGFLVSYRNYKRRTNALTVYNYDGLIKLMEVHRARKRGKMPVYLEKCGAKMIKVHKSEYHIIGYLSFIS